MSERNHVVYQLWDDVAPQTVTSSTDATPIVVTKTAHGYSNGDVVTIYGHTTNIAANGTFRVANKAANTFELTNVDTGANIAGSGSGAGSGGVMISGTKYINVQDFKHIELHIGTSTSGNMTVKVAGSMGIPNSAIALGQNSHPNFGATVSNLNPYNFLQMVDLSDGSSLAGATGFVVAGTDTQKVYEINTNGLMWLCLIPTAWSSGKLSARLSLYDNE